MFWWGNIGVAAEAGVELGAHHVEILQTRNLLVFAMESLGEDYPAEILQDCEKRIPLSTAALDPLPALPRRAREAQWACRPGPNTRVSLASAVC